MHRGLRTGPIPVSGPWITEREVALVAEAARVGWYVSANEFIERFEQAFAFHTGRRYAIALPSCTSAVHLCLAAAGVGAGDEVIVPEITWIATAAPIHYVGARPVFTDVEADYWCLEPASVEANITSRTRAIIAVDIYGNMADWVRLEAIAKRHRLLLIEDSAQSIGATLNTRPAGAFGQAAVFSFHGSKTLTTGEGGMLVTDDEALWRRALCLRDHGRQPGDSLFVNTEVAFKYKMSSMQAALGLGQLERLGELVGRKREIFNIYSKQLGWIAGMSLNQARPGSESSYWMSTAVWDQGASKNDVQLELRRRGIDSRPFFHPLSSLPAYREEPGIEGMRERNPVAYRLSERGLNLPSALMLTDNDVRAVCEVLPSVLAPMRTGLAAPACK